MALFRRELTWQTTLTPEQARDALAPAVRPGSLLAWDRPSGKDARELRGEVATGSFRLIRRTFYRNSFTPVMEGTVVPVEGGSQVTVSFFVHPTVWTLVSVWCALATLVVIWVLDQAHLTEFGILHVSLLLPLIAPLLAWLGMSLEVPLGVAALQEKVPPKAVDYRAVAAAFAQAEPGTAAPSAAPPEPAASGADPARDAPP